MSLETSLQQNNALLEQQNALLEQRNALYTQNSALIEQLISALTNNVVTHTADTEATINNGLLAEPLNKKVKTSTKKKIDNTPVDIETLDLETVVALAVLFKNDAYNLTTDKLAQARAIIEGVSEKRNGQADALDAALQGLQELNALTKATILDLCLEILANWDNIPGITERREFALELLNEGKQTVEPEPEPEPEVDPQTLFAQAEQLILRLAKGGYRTEAVNIIKECGGNKRLGEVPLDNLSKVIRLAEATLED
ncbi:hypothetical protein ID854_03415 [Xenorhabdus sp. M]|uniref:Uncharacterized protein n=1 Tax=Xenorhabdus szentirmaii TaxID=290112 RepID=A0AAW3YQ88_9GAMM|nr:hypothetical protein [Xenorhabdus sp. M]MBD2799531.1 hypothetical protein [Xenorhabdus sp. M]